MALSNINYAAGQDDMDVVFDKTNDCIDAVNELAGGTANQVPYKNDSTDWNVAWTSGVLSTGAITFATGWSDGGGHSIKLTIGGWVEIDGLINISTGGTTTLGTIPEAYRPAKIKRFTIADFNGSDGASVLMIVEVGTDGVIKVLKQSDGTKPSNRTLVFTVNYNIL